MIFLLGNRLAKSKSSRLPFLIVSVGFIGLWIAQFKKEFERAVFRKNAKNTEKAQENGQNDRKKQTRIKTV